MQVLISPESIDEAISIMHCKMDILDVKNTKEGSLGAQFPWNTKRVVELAAPYGLTVSATLGDLPYKPGTAALAAYGCATTGASYIKAGLQGATTYEQAREMMDGIRQAVRMVSDSATVVAAGYADWRRFDGLSATDLVRAAAASECDLVMVDTYIKDGASLFDNMSVDELKAFVKQGHEAGLKVALAGSIKIEHADLLFEIGPDVVGVRGAVCEDSSNRHTRISPQKTDDFVALFAAEGGRREGKVA